MTYEEKLSTLAEMVSPDADVKPESFPVYLAMAAEKILNRCYPFGYDDETPVPTRYGLIQCKIATYFIHKRGADGQTSHSENGVSRGYDSGDVPESMLQEITPKGVVF